MNDRRLGGILGVLVLIVLVSGLVAGLLGSGMAWGMRPGMMWGFSGATAPGAGNWVWGLGMAVGMLGMLTFWAAVILGGVLLVRCVTSATPKATGTPTDDPQTILRRRYAAGEITREQYEDMRDRLAT